MVASQNYTGKIKHWLDGLIEPEQLEAPDRNFAGHRDILTRSLARYHFIAPYVKGTVLEVGCGRGYGPQVYKDRGDYFVGVDLSMNFLSEARDLLRDNQFVQSNGDVLPFKHNSFDTIISLEVIEHIEDDSGFLFGLTKLLKSNGILAISTPSRTITSGNSPRPLDRFHWREYIVPEFYALLQNYFRKVTIFGQFDVRSSISPGNWILDHMGVKMKYLLPAKLQGKFSVAIREPLRLEECQFQQENLESAHTFIALCIL